MSWPATIALVLAAMFVLDRLLLALERLGWIYYRVKKPSTTGAGNALLELQAMLNPASQQVIVVKKEQKAERDDDGGPPDDDWRRFEGPPPS